MSVLNDKILRGGEITATGRQADIKESAYYLMIIPKSEDASNFTVFNVKLSGEKEFKNFPFVVGQWNPVIINDIDVTSTDLSNYRIFYGAE